MTQFKEKAGKDRENASIGLFQLSGADGARHSTSTAQPTFRSATIRSSTSELARDIAQKFNNDFAASIGAHGHGPCFFPSPSR